MKPILTILEPEHFSETALKQLGWHFQIVTDQYGWRPDVLWLRLKVHSLGHHSTLCGVDAAHLRLIACNCTDVSHLPLEECTRRGIEVLSLKGIEGLDNVHATAEHTISLMLQALRHRADRSSGRIGRELRGKEVGVIGFGRIGRQLENALWAFGANLLARDPQKGFGWELDDFIGHCDIVTIHCDLNPTSRGMVNAEFLSKLKPGCILVNTARHAIVDVKAVIQWLERDKEAIYAHDFLDDWWPNGYNPLTRVPDVAGVNPVHDRIIATPHIGGWTLESLHKTEELLAEKVIEWAKTKMEVSV